MGNLFSTSSSPSTDASGTSAYMQNAAYYQKKDPKLTDKDIVEFNKQRAAYFKTTIAICAIYGVIALFMLLIILFSKPGSDFLTEDARPFSVTFIGGLIIIVALLIVKIVTFKPSVLEKNPYDVNMCPDYWKMVPNPVASNMGGDKYTMQYMCVPDTTKINYVNNIQNYANTNSNNLFGPGSLGYRQSTANACNLNCSNVYPLYLADASQLDTVNNPSKYPNLYQCEYAKSCGIPWSSMCPEGKSLMTSS